MRVRFLISAVAGLLAEPRLAAADDLSDCTSGNPAQAIPGCTTIIENRSKSIASRRRS
jgi:hypothetical protein